MIELTRWRLFVSCLDWWLIENHTFYRDYDVAHSITHFHEFCCHIKLKVPNFRGTHWMIMAINLSTGGRVAYKKIFVLIWCVKYVHVHGHDIWSDQIFTQFLVTKFFFFSKVIKVDVTVIHWNIYLLFPYLCIVMPRFIWICLIKCH